MAINFDKFAQEGNLFMKNLAERLGHPEEIGRTGIVLRAVLHALRDRITIGESLNMLSQLPEFLKAVYVEGWKYSDRPSSLTTVEDLKAEVKKLQEQYGEQRFNWDQSTDEIIKVVLAELNNYVSEGEFNNIMAQLPKELEELVRESIHS